MDVGGGGQMYTCTGSDCVLSQFPDLSLDVSGMQHRALCPLFLWALHCTITAYIFEAIFYLLQNLHEGAPVRA